jgi:alpha-galactosidase
LSNCWRTTGDISDNWKSMSRNGFSQDKWNSFAGPGHWNDPDMLVVGKVGWGPKLRPTGLTPDEQYTHITLWCLLSAPLLIGCDMTQMDDFTLSLLTNDEVLAVDQDALGKQASRISQQGDLEVWAKPLADKTWAVGLFNRSDKPADVSVKFADLKLVGPQPVRNLWKQADLGQSDDQFSSRVASHGTVMLKIGTPEDSQ